MPENIVDILNDRKGSGCITKTFHKSIPGASDNLNNSILEDSEKYAQELYAYINIYYAPDDIKLISYFKDIIKEPLRNSNISGDLNLEIIMTKKNILLSFTEKNNYFMNEDIKSKMEKKAKIEGIDNRLTYMFANNIFIDTHEGKAYINFSLDNLKHVD